MTAERVRRGPGPPVMLREGNYRKKALPFLRNDFQRTCAYCLDPRDLRHPSLDHVDHFNCKISGRKRHAYTNLMLACAACNLTKHDKPVCNPLDKRQRLLNCTRECEFPQHIRESEDGQWVPISPEGKYHVTVIGLDEACHRSKRAMRRRLADQILRLLTTAIQYEADNPAEVQSQLMATLRELLRDLDFFPPLVTNGGVLTIRQWLASRGVDTDLLESPSAHTGGKHTRARG